jgi:hypothetical protein
MRAEQTGGVEPTPLECVVQVEIDLSEDDRALRLVWTEVIPTTVELVGHPARPAHLHRPHLPWRRPGEW